MQRNNRTKNVSYKEMLHHKENALLDYIKKDDKNDKNEGDDEICEEKSTSTK
jgi:hypothetical protein